jgi:hypothetical protein
LITAAFLQLACKMAGVAKPGCGLVLCTAFVVTAVALLADFGVTYLLAEARIRLLPNQDDPIILFVLLIPVRLLLFVLVYSTMLTDGHLDKALLIAILHIAVIGIVIGGFYVLSVSVMGRPA